MKAKIIPKSLGEKIREMKGTRNILVHKYRCVDDKTIYEILEDNLKDFEEFIDVILKIK